jgi:hypothetical protein
MKHRLIHWVLLFTRLLAANGLAQPVESLLYQWKNVEIVGGGFVPGIIFSRAERDLIYARTDMGGAYRWNSSTKRWIPLTDWVSKEDWNMLGIESIAPDPKDPNGVYMAVGTYTNSWAGNGAIFRSTNRGENWQRTDMPFKLGANEDGRSMGERLAIDPHQSAIFFLGTRHEGLWKSADKGCTWNKVESFPVTHSPADVGVVFVVFDPQSGSGAQPTPTLFAGVAASPQGQLFRSQDGGKSWQPLPGQPLSGMPHHGELAADGTLYLTYSNGPGPNGVTSGAVWKFSPRNGQWTEITPVKPTASDQFGYAGLSIDAAHPQTLLVSTLDRWSNGDDIFRSTDGGLHWKSLKQVSRRNCEGAPYVKWGRASADFGHWIGCVAIDPFDPGRVLYVTGATIWGTDQVTHSDQDKPVDWTIQAMGLEETAVLGLVSPPQGAHLISALGDISGFRHDDFTRSPQSGFWVNPQFNTTQSIDYAENVPLMVVRVGYGNQQHGAYSLDGAASWIPFSSEPAGPHQAGWCAVSADGQTFLWTPAGNSTFYSRDKGAAWTASGGLPPNLPIIADRVDPRVFYALDSQRGRIYKSMDAGVSFTLLELNAPAVRDGRIKAAPGHAGDLWLTAQEKGLMHSEKGMPFAPIAGVEAAWAIGFGKSAPGQVYPSLYLVGTITHVAGVFRSANLGKSWVRINDAQHQFGGIGQAITGDPRVFGRVYLATNGRGIQWGEPGN